MANVRNEQSHQGDKARSPEKPLDRRAKRTRRLLKESLFALILEKGYDAVTIEDITERADLGRTTFYLHYRDKEALLVEAIQTAAEALIERLPPSIWSGGDVKADQGGMITSAIQITFQHAAENAQVYRIILRGEGASRASGLIQTVIRDLINSLIKERLQYGELKMQVPVDVYTNYFAGALLGLVTWWLEDDMPYPPDEMAEMFRTLFFNGGKSVLGID